MSPIIRFAILTVSDTCSAGRAVDTSGPHLATTLSTGKLIPNAEVVCQACVPDDLDAIKQILLRLCDMSVNVILTTGGTGLSPRDMTPEATRQILEKEIPGMSVAMIEHSLKVAHPHGMLSRSICGVRGKTLIINLPGSKKGSEECLSVISPCIPHAVAVVCNDLKSVTSYHNQVQASEAVHLGCSGNRKNNLIHPQHSHHCHSPKTQSKVDANKIAVRCRNSPYPMIEVCDAQKQVLDASNTLGTEVVSFRDALGCVLSEDVFAKDPLPPFPASVKDGYAVIAADGAGERSVLGSSAAGELPCHGPLTPGYCIRITTGAPVPPGCDSVVQVEDTQLLQASPDGTQELVIKIDKAPVAGQDIRPVGSDITSGQLVLSAGIILGAPELGLLATVGVTSVSVYRRPKIALLSTGNELQEPKEGEDLKAGHIRDSNKTTLMALLQQQGYQAIDMGIAIDEPQVLLEALKKCLDCADVVITTGGVSMGERDLLKNILTTDLKATIQFGRVNMKPGKPTTFATCDYLGFNRLVFGLPGNPVSAMVTCHLFVLPALRAISGHHNPMPVVLKAKITSDLSLDIRPEYHRAWLSWTPGEAIPTARGTGNQISSRLLSCHSCNCLLMLPSSGGMQSCISNGSMVDAMLLSYL